MAKVKAKTQVVKLGWGEMTRIILGFIKDKLILPQLDSDLKCYDLGIEYRDQADDLSHGGNGARHCPIWRRREVREFGLTWMYRGPNVMLRTILGGMIPREPIICSNVPRLMPNWTQPIVIGSHAHGDIYMYIEIN